MSHLNLCPPPAPPGTYLPAPYCPDPSPLAGFGLVAGPPELYLALLGGIILGAAVFMFGWWARGRRMKALA